MLVTGGDAVPASGGGQEAGHRRVSARAWAAAKRRAAGARAWTGDGEMSQALGGAAGSGERVPGAQARGLLLHER
ncbi:hypothetical protein D1643_10795 [Enterorhabdus sp. P55]|nr:hypothetical protein [Enterorhabdus sp. P55]